MSTILQYDTEKVAGEIARVLSPDTYVVLAQNGYGNFEAAAKHIHENRLILRVSLLKLRDGTIETLPDILTAQHISDYLGICRRRIYELFQLKPAEGGIPNFDIGFSKRVEKEDFINWIKTRKQEKEQKPASYRPAKPRQ